MIRVRSTPRRFPALAIAALAAVGIAGTFWTVFGIAGRVQASGQLPQRQARAASAPRVIIEGPFSHDNLALYVVRGASDDDRAYVTLDQGLAARTVAVREKGAAAGQDQSTVNSLEIENKSDKWLFLHAGDVVKGGKQDRTIMTDVLLAPRSKPQTIDAFCVEPGRWTPGQDGLAFKANTAIVSGNPLKRAIQGEKNQSRVWEEVAKFQASAIPVTSPGVAALSGTGTYNAIAEHTTLTSERADYVTALLPSLRKHKDAIGLAVAINGKLTAADVYSSPGLFEALSRKLLDSYALEALLARSTAPQAAPPTRPQVESFLTTAAAARAATETVGESMRRSTRETGDVVMFEYGHLTAANGTGNVTVLHKSYLKK